MNIASRLKRIPAFRLGMPIAGLLLGAVCFGGPSSAQTPVPVPPPSLPDPEIVALKKEIEVLKGKVPDQSHAMKDVAYHFTNLWFAGQKQNWPLAKFYFDETRSHLKWAVRIIPVRKVNGGDLDMTAMLNGVDQSAFVPLQKTIETKNLVEFSVAYQHALDACYSCHAAAGKPYLRLRLPEEPEARIIEFTPAE